MLAYILGFITGGVFSVWYPHLFPSLVVKVNNLGLKIKNLFIKEEAIVVAEVKKVASKKKTKSPTNTSK